METDVRIRTLKTLIHTRRKCNYCAKRRGLLGNKLTSLCAILITAYKSHSATSVIINGKLTYPSSRLGTSYSLELYKKNQ